MNSTAAIAFPASEQPAYDPLEAALAATPALRPVDIGPDQPRLRVLQRNAARLDRPHRGGNDLVVPRLDLYSRLSGAARVTQLAAAAGSGKTVLLRSWIDHAGLASRTTCVLLDKNEHDAQRF